MPRTTGNKNSEQAKILDQYGHILEFLSECSDPTLKGVGDLWTKDRAVFARVMKSMLDDMETEKIIRSGQMPEIFVAARYHHVKQNVFSGSSADTGLHNAQFAYPVLIQREHRKKVGKHGRVQTGDLVIFEDEETGKLDLSTASFAWTGKPSKQHEGTQILTIAVSSAIPCV